MGLALRRPSDQGDESISFSDRCTGNFFDQFSPTQQKSMLTDRGSIEDDFAHQTIFLFKPKDTFFLEQRKRLLEADRG